MMKTALILLFASLASAPSFAQEPGTEFFGTYQLEAISCKDAGEKPIPVAGPFARTKTIVIQLTTEIAFATITLLDEKGAVVITRFFGKTQEDCGGSNPVVILGDNSVKTLYKIRCSEVTYTSFEEITDLGDEESFTLQSYRELSGGVVAGRNVQNCMLKLKKLL